MAITAKPVSYTVNTGHAKCPDHLWMCDEGSGTTLTDKGKAGTLRNLAFTGAGSDLTWAVDGTHGNIVNIGDSNTTNYLYSGNSMGVTAATGAAQVWVIGRWNSTTNPSAVSTLSSLGFNGAVHSSMQFTTSGVLRDYRDDGTNPAVNNSNGATDYCDNALHLFSHKFSNNSGGTSVEGAAWDVDTTTCTFGTPDEFSIGVRNGSSKTLWMSPDAGITFDVIAVMMWINDYATWDNTWISAAYNGGDIWTGVGIDANVLDPIRLVWRM